MDAGTSAAPPTKQGKETTMTMLSTIRTVAATVTAVTILGANAALADPADRWFNLVNESDWTIQAVHVANIDAPTWGPNLLRGYMIEPADYVELDPVRTEGYCEFDILVVFEDGGSFEMNDVDLCTYIDIYTDGYDYELVAI
jgi:hypothetical protein